MPSVVLDDWAFITGPVEMPTAPWFSYDMNDSVDYLPEQVADCLLRTLNFELVHAAEPTWWDWKARWHSTKSLITVGMSLFDIEPYFWGGSGLEGHSDLDELLAIWKTMRKHLPAIYLHNSVGEIHTPQSFIQWVNANVATR